jgi:hypothetical protein
MKFKEISYILKMHVNYKEEIMPLVVAFKIRIFGNGIILNKKMLQKTDQKSFRERKYLFCLAQ